MRAGAQKAWGLRALCAALAGIALAACSADMQVADTDPPGGYTLEVRAENDVKVYLVSAPDGRAAAGRSAGDVSGLMEPEAARAFTVLPEGEASELPEVMALRLPGLDLSIRAEGDASGAEGARVAISAGGRQVHVNAQDDGDGGNERAHVRIQGASEQEAREFIADADGLSAETQAEMLAALGLN